MSKIREALERNKPTNESARWSGKIISHTEFEKVLYECRIYSSTQVKYERYDTSRLTPLLDRYGLTIEDFSDWYLAHARKYDAWNGVETLFNLIPGINSQNREVMNVIDFKNPDAWLHSIMYGGQRLKKFEASKLIPSDSELRSGLNQICSDYGASYDESSNTIKLRPESDASDLKSLEPLADYFDAKIVK